MTILIGIVFGLIWGSFLNVCIYRLPRDMGVVTPRSFCPECGQAIAAYDNIPLLSFFLLARRCRRCQSPISWRYPAVEAISAVFLGALIARFGITLNAGKWMVFESLLIVLFTTDLEERLLPDELTLGGTASGLLFSWFSPIPGILGSLLFPALSVSWQSLLGAALAAVALSLPLFSVARIYQWVRHREGMGQGDFKLLLLIGTFLGLENGILALTIGSVAGSVIGIAAMIRRRSAAFELELPFGSFLCAGASLLPLLRLYAPVP